MKKIIVLVIALSLFLFSGCGDSSLLYKDGTYIIKRSENGVSVEIVASYVPSVHEVAKEYIDVTTMPYLTILKHKDGKLTVSSYNYDRDAKKNFKLWTLDTSNNITFNSITVVDDNGDVSVENVILSQEDYQYIGEYYSHGYFEFNNTGKVEHITFYGETVIQG